MTTYSEPLTILPGKVLPPLFSDEERVRVSNARTNVRAKNKRNGAEKRRWALLNALVDSGMANLKPSDSLVWLALFRCADPAGIAAVARTRMVTLTGLDPKTVTKSLSRLVEAGWLVRLHRGGPTSGLSRYCVCAPAIGGKNGQE